MALQLALHPAARQEIVAAGEWYEEQRPGLGEAFARWLTTAIDRICSQPYIYPLLGQGLHRTIPGRFPYQIIYRVQDHLIVVVSVFHERGDPAALAARLAGRLGDH